MDLSKVRLHLNQLFPNSNFVILGVRAYYEYTDGKRTEKLLGHRYEVAEDHSFERFDVKVPGTEPAITQEALEASTSRLYATFTDSVVRFYRTPDGRWEISITAKEIALKHPTSTGTVRSTSTTS